MAVTAKSAESIKTVEHAFDLLEVISETDGDFGVTQLSARLGLNKSRVHRLLTTLERRGYIERDLTVGRYRAGLAAYVTGRKLLHQNDLPRLARPFLDDLARRCNEAVYLALADGNELVLMEVSEPFQPVRISPLVGRRCGFLLARGGRQVVVDRGGFGEGVCSLTVPLLREGGTLLGGLCLVAPDFRVPRERLEREFAPRLRRAARLLSIKLGYGGEEDGGPVAKEFLA